MPLHFHNGYQLALLEEGELELEVAGERHRARAGLVILFNAGEPHQLWAVEAKPVSARIVEVGPDRMARALGEGEGVCFGAVVVDDAPLADQLRDVHDGIARGVSTPELGQQLEEVLCQSVESYGRPFAGLASVSAQRLERVRDRLRQALGERISLDALAEEVGVSKYGLVRSFRRRFGLPPITYHLQLRLERAKELLAEGAPTAEVACATGFADQAHLTRHFRRRTLMTPGAYARQVRG